MVSCSICNYSESRKKVFPNKGGEIRDCHPGAEPAETDAFRLMFGKTV